MKIIDNTTKKYKVTQENKYKSYNYEYGGMDIYELKKFLTKYIYSRGCDLYIFSTKQELDERLKNIEKYGEEILTIWSGIGCYHIGYIEIKEIVENELEELYMPLI